MPARHLEAIFRICHLAPEERQAFMAAYDAAHPGHPREGRRSTTPVESTNSSGIAGLAAAVTQAAGTSAGTGAQTVSPLTSAAMPGALQGLVSTMASWTPSTGPS